VLSVFVAPAPTVASVGVGPAAIATATDNAGVATITTTGAHGLLVGQSVRIAGVSETGYNGTFIVTGVADSTHFTYAYTVTGPLLNGSGGTSSHAPSAAFTASRLTSLVVNFSTNVTIAAGAFTLTSGALSISSAAAGNITVAGSGTNQITLTFTDTINGVEFGSLMDGIWTLSIDGTKVTAVSGGTPMAPGYSQGHIRRLFGDVNGDGTVEGGDFSVFSSTFNLSSADAGFLSSLDFNGDGTVEGGDFSVFSARFNTSL
jgi:Dockerin type I domain